MVKFALITDVHYGEDNPFHKGNTLGASAPKFLSRFVRAMNTTFKPDFVVSLGDMFRDRTAASDRNNLRAFLKHIAGLHAPPYFVIGNHDIKNLKDAELKKMLGIKRFFYSFDHNGIRFIVLYTFAKITSGPMKYAVRIKPHQLAWLADALQTKKPVIILNHYPLDEQNIRTNPYAAFFEKYSKRVSVNNRKPVRALLERANVLAVFSGHLHWKNKHVINGIPYYTAPSLTEAKHGAWAEVTVNGSRVTIRHRKTTI